MVRNCSWLIATPAVLVLIFSGCSEDDGRNLPMAPVSGTVTYKTELPEGKIVFQHPSGETVAAEFGPDGEYETEVPQGKNNVLVTSLESSIPESQDLGPESRAIDAMEIYTSRIPDRYSNFASSRLEVEVKEGPNTFDIKLEDK